MFSNRRTGSESFGVRPWVTLAAAVTAVWAITIAAVPASAAQSGRPQRAARIAPFHGAASTSLRVGPGVHQGVFLPLVTPDGRYLLVSGHGKQWFEGMNGRKYAVSGGMGVGIYGSTPNGDVIMRSVAGGAPLWYVFRPGVGVVKWLPGKQDAYAKSAFAATESAQGLWAVGVTDTSGAEPMQPYWVDIGGHPAPTLQDVRTVRWSPNGKILGVLAGSGNTAWLETYSPQTRTRTLGQAVSLSQGPQSAPGPTLAWSPTGRFLATPGKDQIAVYDTVARRGELLAIPRSTMAWGFAGTASLFTVAPNAAGNTDVTEYALQGLGSAAAQSVMKQNGVTSRMAQTASKGVAAGRAQVPGKILVTVTTPNGLILVQTNRGAIDLIDGSNVQTLVSGGADSWWYDRGNGYLYYGLKSQEKSGAEPVWRMRVS